MAKASRNTRPATHPAKPPSVTMLILKGAFISIITSVLCIVTLALITLATENTSIESYAHYIMVGVSLLSIFIGSAWATKEAQARGLLIGMTVGVIYVLLSLAIGLELNQETLSLLVVANKLSAGLAAGALGGLVGVNL